MTSVPAEGASYPLTNSSSSSNRWIKKSGGVVLNESVAYPQETPHVFTPAFLPVRTSTAESPIIHVFSGWPFVSLRI